MYGTIPINISSASGLGGWSEKWQFLLTFNTIYADVGWVDKKVQKYADVL